jgi:hypothetical protein
LGNVRFDIAIVKSHRRAAQTLLYCSVGLVPAYIGLHLRLSLLRCQ